MEKKQWQETDGESKERGWDEGARGGKESQGRRGLRRPPDTNVSAEGDGQRGAAPPPRGRVDEPTCPSSPSQGAAGGSQRGAPPLPGTVPAALRRSPLLEALPGSAAQRQRRGRRTTARGRGSPIAAAGPSPPGTTGQRRARPLPGPRPRSRGGGGAQGRRGTSASPAPLRSTPGPAPPLQHDVTGAAGAGGRQPMGGAAAPGAMGGVRSGSARLGSGELLFSFLLQIWAVHREGRGLGAPGSGGRRWALQNWQPVLRPGKHPRTC